MRSTLTAKESDSSTVAGYFTSICCIMPCAK